MKDRMMKSLKHINAMLPILVLMAVASILTTVPPASAEVALHPHELPRLEPDAHFPRCTYRELNDIGFPDHMHAWAWSDWEPMTGDDGHSYGPGAFCKRKVLLPREGLEVLPGVKRFGRFVLQHNPDYADCDMVQGYLFSRPISAQELSKLLVKKKGFVLKGPGWKKSG